MNQQNYNHMEKQFAIVLHSKTINDLFLILIEKIHFEVILEKYLLLRILILVTENLKKFYSKDSLECIRFPCMYFLIVTLPPQKNLKNNQKNGYILLNKN